MSESNLSKTKPALRTKGNVTGNFGVPKVKSGSSLNDIGYGEVGCMPTIRQQLGLFMRIYPRMSVQWRRNMLPTMRQWAATLNMCDKLKQVQLAYDL